MMLPWEKRAETARQAASVFELVHRGRPVPQGRPRAFQMGGRVVVAKAQASRAYEHELAASARLRAEELGWLAPPKDARIGLTVVVWRAADQGDLSNFVKAAEDALTEAGIWIDDRRVVSVVASMFVDRDDPRVELGVRVLP